MRQFLGYSMCSGILLMRVNRDPRYSHASFQTLHYARQKHASSCPVPCFAFFNQRNSYCPRSALFTTTSCGARLPRLN